MKKIFNVTSEVVKKMNMFTAPVNLRYDLDPDYETFAGGFLSIILFALFAALFLPMGIDMINKNNITTNTQRIQQYDSQQMSISSKEFLFTLGIKKNNGLINAKELLNSSIFDIRVTYYNLKKELTTQRIKLQQCTYKHYSNFGNQLIQRLFMFGNLQLYLCPPLYYIFHLSGNLDSPQFDIYQISLHSCKDNQNCASKQQMQEYFQDAKFQLVFRYTNTLINPQQKEPIKYFLQYKDNLAFSKTKGKQIFLYLTEIQIDTDESLFPWTNINQIISYFVDRSELFTNQYNYDFVNDQYGEGVARVLLMKSNNKLVYQRSFTKIDQFLSYIGGLFGFILILFSSLMNYYGQCSFQLELCQQIFDYSNKDKIQNKKQDEIKSNSLIRDWQINKDKNLDLKEKEQQIVQPESFGIFDFFCHLIYKIIPKKLKNKWRRMQIYHQSVEQMRYKLDIGQMIQKFAFYDRAISALFTQNQLKILYLQQKFNFQEVRRQRQLLQLKKQIIESKMQLNNTSTNKIQKRKIDQHIYQQSQISNQSEKGKKKMMHFIIGQQFNLFMQSKKNKEMGNVIPEEIKQALNQLLKNIQQGDQISKRIYYGIQSNILQAFQKSKKQSIFDFLKFAKFSNNEEKMYKNDNDCLSSNQLIQLKMMSLTPQSSKRKLQQEN